MRTTTFQRLTLLLPILCVLLVCYLIYMPGLSGGFLFDDTINITQNKLIQIDKLTYPDLYGATLSSNSGPLKRPVSMFSFAVNHRFSGLNPYDYKLTNLIIHLITGIGLFLFTYLLLNAYRTIHKAPLNDSILSWISLLVTAAWLFHPINLSSVLYIVQRMNSLSALFTFWGLAIYLWGRLRQLNGSHGAIHLLTGLVLFGGLASFSKENGLLFPLYIFLMEYLILNFNAEKKGSVRFVQLIALSTVIIPAAVTVALFAHSSLDWLLDAYSIRHFSLLERVLTECRILVFYLRMIILPDITLMGLFHDDIAVSTGFLKPWTTLTSILLLMTLIVTALGLKKKAPILSFGILFFFIGHSLESTLLPLELVHEHRNYLPSYGILLIIFYYLFLWKKLDLTIYKFLLSASILTLLAVNTAVRASYWGNDMELALVNQKHHPNSVRSLMHAGRTYFEISDQVDNPQKLLNKARPLFERAEENDTLNLAGSFSLILLDDREQKPQSLARLYFLTDRLRNKPFLPSNALGLQYLIRCQVDGPCKLPDELINQLLSATLENPTLKGKNRAHILTAALHFAYYRQDIPKALRLAEMATQHSSSDPQIHLNYAQFLTLSGKFHEAEEQIKTAKALTNSVHFLQLIHGQETLLEQAKLQYEQRLGTPTGDL